jgi:RimJ/RimL family protein N-acetyltransferase
MGFRFEGIQESHIIAKGRSRDTAWFRILETEWPAVREQLEAMLYGTKQ